MTLNWAVVVANMVMAAAAAAVQFRAAAKGLPELRACNAAAGILAVIYVIAYGILLAIIHDGGGSWSMWLRPVALLAWAIVWIGPALISVRLYRRLHHIVEELQP